MAVDRTPTPAEFVNRLTSAFEERGRPFALLRLLQEAEAEHSDHALPYKGYWAISNALKCLFLETTALVNDYRSKPGVLMPEYYALFVPKLVHNFSTICAAEHAAALGYPMQGFTLLRNVFDQSVLTSAAAQGMVGFYSLEGVMPGTPLDPRQAKRLKKQTEFEVRRKFTGDDCGLSAETRAELDVLDALYDYETHGGQVSLADAMPWMNGQEGLRVVPEFKERRMAAFFNRANECQWMLHRLLPFTQAVNSPFPETWGSKWRLLDESFHYIVRSLTDQLGKRIGAAIVEFVEAKFPFSEKSGFPR
ncbi:MAG TPA: hypothetical protein VMD49_10780 [Steroidobacteraceae bacterium]|nr:hypothetical protein [Steroidobacteraceae bacterium]